MSERGRKSAAALSVASNVVGLAERPKPPAELSKDEAAVWVGVVDSKPSDWFTPGDIPILADYCRHVIRQRLLSDQINKVAACGIDDPDDYQYFSKLLSDSEKESKVIKSLAVAMRLTQQSRYTPQAAGTATKKQQRKPWET